MDTSQGDRKTRRWHKILGIVAATALFACAHVVSPTGGPRDETPPEMTRSTPPMYTTNFKGGQIRIFFNEFIALHNIRQQLLISPPLEQTPDISVRGRSIVMEIDETLRPNTTYNFFFGDAIRDITEGNPIPNFQFVVSTGDYVDSLSIGGHVVNAFNLKPEQGVYVMLYDNVYDSVPYLERPVYLAKTDKNGSFIINNMAGGEYLLFALDDQNNNFKYDPYEERIAFLDSLVRPTYISREAEEHPDTLPPNDADATGHPDAPDDVQDRPTPPANGIVAARGVDDVPEYRLLMFQEEDTVQRVLSSSLVHRGLIRVAFRIPFDSVSVREIREPLNASWHIPEFSQNKDTLLLWFPETGRDTLFLEISDAGKVLDTIQRATSPRRIRDDGEEAPGPLGIALDAPRPSAVPFFQPLTIRTDRPVVQVDTARIELLSHDSIPLFPGYRVADQARRRIELDTLPEEGATYFLNILPGAFTDLFGATNDTLAVRLASTSRESYGSLILDVRLPDDTRQYILQLLGREESILREKIIKESGRYAFRHLRAGQYNVRLAEDASRSGQWDTGHYLRKQQPEPVHMLPDTLRIRENWDVELEWIINGSSR